MRKADIAKHIQDRAGISHTEATELLDRVLTLLKATLKIGESVMIAEFGTFMIRAKTARVGRNPRTGETVTIPSRRVVTFRASAKFKEAVNQSATVSSGFHEHNTPPISYRAHARRTP
jgi:integration host factor subunit alpha